LISRACVVFLFAVTGCATHPGAAPQSLPTVSQQSVKSPATAPTPVIPQPADTPIDTSINTFESSSSTASLNAQDDQVDVPSADELPDSGNDIQSDTSQNDTSIDTSAEPTTLEDTFTEELDVEIGLFSKRREQEKAEDSNPFVLTAHKHNYILPVSYSSRVNDGVYQQNDVPLRDGLRDIEVKFQISLKTKVNEKDLLFVNDSVSLAITLEAWWQLYLKDLSSPFRESNYQPEIFYTIPVQRSIWGGNTAFVIGLEHQSNGQVQGLSRSWNRLYTTFIYERGQMLFRMTPWYRLPEELKRKPQDAAGDDNPDIIDFMGYGEAAVSWRDGSLAYSVRGRGNPRTGKGAIDLGFTFPFFARFQGFVRVFSGYGDSLIDYNHRQTRLGLGVALTPLY